MNYHHLLYFWSVARDGSIAAAARRLRLTPQTLSAQIRTLEESLGQPLFERNGGRLDLTEAGRLALHYADEIFALGAELHETLRVGGGALRVRVGVEDTLTKMVVQRLLAPVLANPRPMRVVCTEGSKVDLAARLAGHELDLVLTDGPLATGSSVKVSCRMLTEGDVAMYAAPALAARLRGGFPGSLDGAPVLLPLETASLRQALDRWFSTVSVRLLVKAELADSALTKALACEGAGVFAAPVSAEGDIKRHYGVERVGLVDGVRDRLFVAVTERMAEHPAVTVILESAAHLLDGAPDPRTTAA
jgi:LysR family transcriptional regulator, transcriptional activator of nhaA